MTLTEPAGDYLLGLARRAVERGLALTRVPAPELSGCPAEALVERASFVTLTRVEGELRGCRGVLEARRTLAADVWHNAWSSAFEDPRFPPVGAGELPGLQVEISVLGPLEPLAVATEAELSGVLVPGLDGVVLGWRGRRATFLPQVWEQLPDPGEFLAHLRQKAGLPPGFWAADIEVSRYRVQKLAGEAGRFATDAVPGPA